MKTVIYLRKLRKLGDWYTCDWQLLKIFSVKVIYLRCWPHRTDLRRQRERDARRNCAKITYFYKRTYLQLRKKLHNCALQKVPNFCVNAPIFANELWIFLNIIHIICNKYVINNIKRVKFCQKFITMENSKLY